MSLQDVERAIKRVRVHLHEFQRDHPRGPMNLDAPANNVEMSTRYIVVDPVLRSLGWDLSDPSQCIVEYATAGGSGSLPRVDYALIGRDGCPVVLVEAKRLLLSGRMASNEDHSRARKVKWDKAYYALCDYLNGVNVNDVDAVKVGVLTNGQEWEIISATDEEWVFDDKPLCLGSRWVRANARRLIQCLGREHYW